MPKKNVYFFGGGSAEGRADMKNLLGGKGANLAEMSSLGIPVPAGFTITTEVCTAYYENKGQLPDTVVRQSEKCLKRTEAVMGKKFGSMSNPLLLSVRSGARQSMPGMMDTVLNVGLSSKTIPGLIEKTGNARFVYDSYRRLITMYADVVMEKAAGIELKGGKSIREKLEHTFDELKHKRRVTEDSDLDADDLKAVSEKFKRIVKQTLKKDFPDDAHEQLWGAIRAVFQSWNGKRAFAYRRITSKSD